MKEIVILGAGYAGLRALHYLQAGHGDYHITLIDRNDYHYEATDLHEVAAGTQPKEKITYPIRDVIKEKVTTFVQATVTKIDREQQQVLLEDGNKLSYDYLIVSLGFRSESFGIPGVEENALEMVDVPTAEKVYQHIIAQMKDYAQTKKAEDLKIIVCGAGFTGVELLGALSDKRADFAQFAGVAKEKIEIFCVEAVTRLLPMFDEKLADYGITSLKNWGVKFLTGKPIKEIKPGVVVYQDDKETGATKELAANTIIWTTGVSGSRVMDASGFSQRRGRVMVAADLTDPEYSNVSILGDVSAVMNKENNRPYPTTAQIALKMGEYAAKNILTKINGGGEMADFTFKSLGTVASIGNTHAFGTVGHSAVKGFPASFLKKAIMDKSLFETGGFKEVFAKGRFDLYH
ncbi:NAD(P)/FAD-dependent oxidoreductase [Liquorilactobacillus satsumensis]|uniref:Pyridine nucleotide-disulfide family oxidoreductase n=1 Tax=Liquorilactobacillus satsumensis DSM 16230 = JCM 12392 TaxID=1423801 RepID=A0A0R1V414_9LACO|nr:NAD(P)/FAD-dependent oxidoreductase [Liquorilactobacillus satsumensis]KRM00328.1 pyridine nucleotide-disulfide family oxidoreductase [Liquorilactobacillus satsumensis DSM 16230 = JCM 12392]MCC7667724.1 NAD(P)/FAD-dependent oxidoreductase [Liquorilactobacillus satsumensis]MCP9313665.1 NAD(P)/FAD-dependent oxidoreductase [Liquorilactobacillus satsumensis]MCP9328987.1 NAD(P)/FAD-dependent oxidoreductase [Liquorilactobacillus satsumensis]MCP9357697.1 NAD(P)/FAD-dependent oxidoreductase [Liquori